MPFFVEIGVVIAILKFSGVSPPHYEITRVHIFLFVNFPVSSSASCTMRPKNELKEIRKKNVTFDQPLMQGSRNLLSHVIVRLGGFKILLCF